MGNSLHGVSLLRNRNGSNHVRLGNHATIDLTENKAEKDGQLIEEWTVRYTVDGSSCALDFTRHSDQHGNVKRASVDLDDNTCSGNNVSISIYVETDPVRLTTTRSGKGLALNFTVLEGNITAMKTFSYGSGNKGGLLVLDSKDKVDTKLNTTVTVAHYYGAIIGNFFSPNRIDIGLSVIAKIRMSNTGNLDITVEGPLQHPATALFYMFDEVNRSENWKRTMCPHCADIQRRRSGMFWQSESEDSDNLPPPRLHGPRHIAGSVLANDGAVRGNYNGNFNVRNLFLKGRSL